MEELFAVLNQAKDVLPLAADLMGRQKAYAAVVTENNDPLGLRRIKVNDPVNTGIDSPWLMRYLPFLNYDPPLPTLGTTVLVMNIGDDITKGFYAPMVNQANPPSPKVDPVLDSWATVPGAQFERTGLGRIIDVGASLILRTDSGSQIELAANGTIIIEAAGGARFVLGAGITTNAANFSVAGAQLATIGAVDTAGHALVTRGY